MKRIEHVLKDATCVTSVYVTLRIVGDHINFCEGGIVLKGIDLFKISGCKKWSISL